MFLPKAPDDSQKYLFVKQNRGVFYFFAILSSAFLFSGMFIFVYTHPATFIYGIFVLLSLIYILISYSIGLLGKSFNLEEHQKIIEAGKDFKPSVDVYLPVCGENFEIIKNTWQHVSQLDWPKDKLNVYVLDDGWKDELKALAQEFGFNYIRRDNRPTLKKAGNIRNAFAQTTGNFILILDADFCPRHDFLNETVPYMLDEKIAILQTPQFFEVNKQMSWLEQGSGFVQELFYRLIQVSRNTWNASICVGSCGLYRRSALEPQGGTYAIEHSEDLHTGFSMLIYGYAVRYIPINLAMGVCPDTLSAYFIQQYRWCTGSTSLLTNPMFWKQKLHFMARISYLSGMGYYIVTALAIFISPLPAVYMVWFFPDKLVWFTIIFYLPSFLFGTVFSALWSKSKFTLHSIRARQVSYYAHFFALKDRVLKTTVPWIATGACKNNLERFITFRNTLWIWTSFVTGLILAGSVSNMENWLDYNFYPTIFFTLYNYYINSTILKEQ